MVSEINTNYVIERDSFDKNKHYYNNSVSKLIHTIYIINHYYYQQSSKKTALSNYGTNPKIYAAINTG